MSENGNEKFWRPENEIGIGAIGGRWADFTLEYPRNVIPYAPSADLKEKDSEQKAPTY